ncbi:MAG: hypothetical protein R3B09_00705 [Nannocystaceae bacterium]
MPKKPPKTTVDHVFTFTTDADLDAQVAAFRAAHEASAGVRLAMDAKRPLGAGKARVTFRVVGGR